jgi:hypothetical protein
MTYPPNKEKVYEVLGNKENGLTLEELQKIFYGAKNLTEREKRELDDFLDSNIEEDHVFLEANLKTKTITYFSDKFRNSNTKVS